MEIDLFGDYTPKTYTLKELESADFGFFVSNTNYVDERFGKLIRTYTDGENEKPFYHLDPFYNTAIKNKEYRFLLVTTDGGDVLYYPYKVVRIVTTRQIRFFDVPLSNSGEGYTEKYDERRRNVIETLSRHDFVRFVYKDDYSRYFDGLDGRKAKHIANCDEFFYSISSDAACFENNRWRKKHFVNRIIANPDVEYFVTGRVDVKETMALRRLWMHGMTVKGDNVRVSTERAFESFLRNTHNGNVNVVSLYYRHTLIAQEIFLVDAAHRRCESLYCTHIFDSCGDDELKHIVNRMVAIQKFLSWVFLRSFTDTVYIGTGASDKLYGHKLRTTDGFIKYNIC